MLQVRAWYTAVSIASYHPDVHGALATLVSSIGTGPWGAGLWWGDSQLFVLAMWIGQALAASDWGMDLPLDYYIYSAFTESPGSQCLVLPREQCAACTRRCVDHPLPATSYWLPSYALTREDAAKMCAAEAADCGERGLAEIVATFGSLSVHAAWERVETALLRNTTTESVFDVLLGRSASPIRV